MATTRILAATLAATLVLPCGGCGAIALGLVAYQMGKDTGTHVQKCSQTSDGLQVCVDQEKGALQR